MPLVFILSGLQAFSKSLAQASSHKARSVSIQDLAPAALEIPVEAIAACMMGGLGVEGQLQGPSGVRFKASPLGALE